MHRRLCVASVCALAALAVAGCNGEGGAASTPSDPAAALPGSASNGSSSSGGGAASSGSGSSSGSSGGTSGSGGSIPIPIPISPGVPGISIGVASSWSALAAGKYASSFDVITTDDLLVVAKVGSKYEGAKLGLNFQSPSGGTLAGYTAIVSNGEAHFDVKLGGTAVGKSGQTGVFPMVLGDLGTQQEIVRTAVTLVRGVSQ